MRSIPLGEIIVADGRPDRDRIDLPVYSVTKHVGFIPSLEYFKKQVFSKNVSTYKHVAAGDFAYATIHLDEGSIGIAPEDCLISPMYTVFRSDTARVDPSYLLRYLKSPDALARYATMGRGAIHRRQAISLETLRRLPVPLPRIDEQRRITAILDQADALRAKRREQLALLDALPQAIFQQVSAAHEGAMVELGSLTSAVRNGVSPATRGSHEAFVLTLTAVTAGTFDPTFTKTGRFNQEPPANKRVQGGDLLFCRGNGNLELVGRCVVAPNPRADLVFPDTVIALTLAQNDCAPAYVAAACNAPGARKQIEAVSKTTNGTFKINQQSLSKILIPLPPLDVQHAFTARLEELNAQKSRVARALGETDACFAALQSQAFRGEL